jgi:hypothetical protein
VTDVTRVDAVTMAVMAALLGGSVVRAQPAAESAAAKAPGAFEWAPTAFVQLDVRGFPGWHLDPDDTRLRRDTFEVRRVRAGVDGTWRELRFELSVDPAEWNEPPIQDAWVEWRPSRAVRLRGGQFKLPGGREYGTSSRRLGFLERSPLSESLAAGRDTGTQADLRMGRNWHAKAGVFLGDGRGRQHRGGATVASRVQWRPWTSLEIAGYGTVGHVAERSDADDPSGLNGRATSSYRFFNRVYVQGQRRRLGGDVEWRRRNWRATAELLRVDDQRLGQGADFSDLPPLRGLGVTTALRWQRRGPMAGVRYDRITFDDTGAATPSASVRPRAADVRPRGSDAVTISAGWRLSRWLHMIGESAVERYFEPRSAPTPERQAPYVSLGLRLQVEWPQ